MLYTYAQSPIIYYLFSHGIIDSHTQSHKYMKSYTHHNSTHHNQHWIMQQPIFSFDYPDAKERFIPIKLWHSSLGQTNEIDALHNAYRQLKQSITPHTAYKIVLVGVSRGASTIINFLAAHQPTDIAAAIIESPFAHTDHVVKHIAQQIYIHKIPHLDILGQRILSFLFRAYTPWGKQPIDYAPDVPHTIPLLILCSKKDRVIPWNSSYDLYLALKNAGHPHVDFHAFEHGQHAFLINRSSGQEFMHVVHDFYKKYQIFISS